MIAARVSRRSVVMRHLDSIYTWAKAQPETSWIKGAADPAYPGYVAIRMESGSILTGMATICSERMQERIRGTWCKGRGCYYGKIVAHLLVGD